MAKLGILVACLVTLAVSPAMARSNGAGSSAPVPQTPPSGMSCPGDKLVWVNTKSGVYHFQGDRYFGKTKSGKFMCEHAADSDGDRPTRNGQ